MLTSPLSSPLRSALSSAFAVRRGGGAPAFDPATLFASGEVGAWYDPSDITTLFQDSAGTTPVTAAGQSVGRMNSKGGGVHHLTATGTARPVYQVDGSGFPYLQGNGTTSRMATASGVDLTAATRLFYSAAVRVEGTGNQAIFSNNSAGTSRFVLLYLAGASPVPRASLSTSGGDTQITVPAKGAAPYLAVNSMLLDTGGASSNARVVLRQDGVVPAQTVASAGGTGGAFSNQPFSLFSASSAGDLFNFNGRFYGGVIRAALTSDADALACEEYLAAKMGVFF
jgi:hypothetical protein